MLLAGYFSKSKYAFMASVRCIILSLNLEIFLGLLFINIILFNESFSFTLIVGLQEIY